MKKQFAIFLATCLLTVVLGYSLHSYKEYFLLKPFQKVTTFNNIHKVRTDPSNNTYVIADSKQSLVKLDPDGTLAYKLRPYDTQDDRVFHQFSDMVSDSKGNLYVLYSQMDINGLEIKKEEIVRYTLDGKRDMTWIPYTLVHEAKRNSLRGNSIHSIRIFNDVLQVITEHNSTVHVENVSEEGKSQPVATIQLPPESYVASISSTPDGSQIWATTKKGKLFRVSESPERISVDATYPESIQIVGEWGYFIEGYGESLKRFRLTAPEKTETLVSPEMVEGHLETEDSIVDMSIASNGQLVLGLSDRIIRLADNQTLSTVTHSYSMQLFQYAFWLGGLVLLILVSYASYILYVRIMPCSIIYKQLFIFIPIILGALAFLSFFVFNKFSTDMDWEAKRQLVFVAHDGQNLIEGDKLEQFHSPSQFMNDTYRNLRSKITFEDNFGKFYMSAYRVVGDNFYHVLEDDSQFRMMDYFPIDSFSGPMSCSIRDKQGEWVEIHGYKPIVEQKQYAACTSEDGDGQWMYALGPLFNSDKTKVVGMYETGINTYAFDMRKNADMLMIVKVILIIAVVLIVMFIVVTMTQLTPIRRLKRSVDAMASKDLDAKVIIRSKDEVAHLGERFNLMADNLKKYIADIQIMSQSYFRFVPQQFLDLIGRSRIMDVHLGDQTRREMTILVTNLRNFHQLSIDMDNPEKNFQYMNLFLEKCCPHIRHTDGFIGKYMGSGILALYADDAENAIRASIGMNQTLHEWNKSQAQENMPIQIGTGIHTGKLMLGVIGEGERLDTGIISDDVNMSNKLESLSKELGISILVSKVAFDTVLQRSFEYRTIGLVQIPGLEKPMELYDVFEGDSEPVRSLKRATKNLFEEAVLMYQQARFSDARAAFLEVIRQNQGDKAAKLYFYHCDEYFVSGPKQEWNGEISA